MKKLIFFCVVFLLLVCPLFFGVLGYCSGDSMKPTLDNNMIILDTSHLQEDLTNKIVSYRFNDTLTVCHRVLIDEGAVLITKGDNNSFRDPQIYRSQIVGVVTYVIPTLFWYVYVSCLVFSCSGVLVLVFLTIKAYTQKESIYVDP